RDDGLHPQAQIGVEAILGHEDQGRHEALERIPSNEKRRPLPFLQMQDAESNLLEIGLIDLKELIARIGLQDVQQCLAVIAAWSEAGGRERRVQLAAQQWDVAQAPAIG